jgi:hypothetical protein
MISFRAYGQKDILIMPTKSSYFLEYMKLHLISLIQDLDKVNSTEDNFKLVGQIEATEHLLSVATDIMNSSNERYE